MTDTPEPIIAVMAQRMRKKTGEERLRMGFSMFDFAKMLMTVSQGSLPTSEMRKAVFLRLYGNDFDEVSRAKILRHLEQSR